jgi:hypothetical protein
MSQTNKGLVVGIVVAAVAAALALAIFAAVGNDHDGMMDGYRGYGPGMMYGYGNGSGGYGYGPGMMNGYRGGYGPGMMSGGYGIPATSAVRSASAADLNAIRGDVNAWLDDHSFKGFRVAHVMAFTNNDYVAVDDASGHGAFELLSAPRGQWLMPEPGPNMMWNTRYGMMRGYHWITTGAYGPGMMSGFGAYASPLQDGRAISSDRARQLAQRWLDENYPGEKALDSTAFPGYYTIDVGTSGHPSGMLSVNASTGAIWYHSWHGRFLAERDF